MKKTRLILGLLSTAITMSLFTGVTSFAAFDNGYVTATTLNNSYEEYFYDSSQVDWYKFTVSESDVPTAYTVTLVVPNGCMYNFDLRYREAGSTARPSIVSNETYVGSTRRRIMRGLFTEPGEYFIRIYSQNGTYDEAYSYRISKSFEKNITHSFILDTSDKPQISAIDWAICADVVGHYVYDNNIPYYTNSRNYKNAYTFIDSGYTSDSEDGYGTSKKGTPEETATALNYIYSGDLMLKPKYVTEIEKIYEIQDLMRFVWEYDEPIIFYLNNLQWPDFSSLKKYYILDGVNLGENTIDYYDPNSDNDVTIDYDVFLTEGLVYEGMDINYTGTNIVPATYKKRTQPAFN